MAVVIVNEITGGNQDFYEQVNPKVMPGGQLPEGCQAHIAGPIEGGWRVITVWDSDERFQQFRDETLIQPYEMPGATTASPRRSSPNPVHNLMTA